MDDDTNRRDCCAQFSTRSRCRRLVSRQRLRYRTVEYDTTMAPKKSSQNLDEQWKCRPELLFPVTRPPPRRWADVSIVFVPKRPSRHWGLIRGIQVGFVCVCACVRGRKMWVTVDINDLLQTFCFLLSRSGMLVWV